MKPNNKKLTPGQAVKRFCIECVGSPYKVKNCGGDQMLNGTTCPLYPYRNGRGRPSVKTVRRECMICMNGQRDLIRHCASVKCNLFKFRLGTNPNIKQQKNSFKADSREAVLAAKADEPFRKGVSLLE